MNMNMNNKPMYYDGSVPLPKAVLEANAQKQPIKPVTMEQVKKTVKPYPFDPNSKPTYYDGSR